jgi:membrane protease YdiL (CAAX protease family)
LADVPALVITLLLVGLLLVLAEMVRALLDGDLITLRRPRRPLVVEWHVVAVAAVFVLVFVLPAVIESVRGRRLQEGGASEKSVVFSIIVSLVIFGAVVPLLAATGKNRLADYGLDMQGWRAEMRYGGLGYLVSIPLVLAVMVVMGLAALRGPQHVHPYLKLLETGNDSAIIGVAFAAVVAAPLAEELIFRVVLQGLLESALPSWAAILIPAVAFAAIHGRHDALPLFPLAVVLGIVYHLRRSFVAVFTIHAMFNATFLVLTLCDREFS